MNLSAATYSATQKDLASLRQDALQEQSGFSGTGAGRMCSVHIYLVIKQLSSDCGRKGCGFVQDGSDQLSSLLLKSP